MVQFSRIAITCSQCDFHALLPLGTSLPLDREHDVGLEMINPGDGSELHYPDREHAKSLAFDRSTS
jgi:hypothetical protein